MVGELLLEKETKPYYKKKLSAFLALSFSVLFSLLYRSHCYLISLTTVRLLCSIVPVSDFWKSLRSRKHSPGSKASQISTLLALD